MKNLLVKDFLRAINDYGYTKLINYEGGLLSLYDGKNSIEEKYNEYEVTSIGKEEGFIVLEVRETLERLTKRIASFIMGIVHTKTYNENGGCVCVVDFGEIFDKFHVAIADDGLICDGVYDCLWNTFGKCIEDIVIEENDFVVYLKEEYCYNV